MTEKRSLTRRFFGGIWRLFDILRKLAIALMLLISVGFLALLIFAAMPPPVEDNVALVWAPQGELIEADTPPAANLLPDLLGTQVQQTELRALTEALRHAADDPRIRLLYLKLDGLTTAGFGQLQTLVDALQAFRESGKKVVAFAPNYSQAQYMLAAQADELYLDPIGAVMVPGMGRFGYYYREALDKLEIDMHIFRAGAYKSAVEPFTRNDMSPEAAAATRDWLDVLWGHYVETIAATRDLNADVVRAYAEDLPENVVAMGGDTAKVALNAGLVDELTTLHEVRSRVGGSVGMDEKHGSFRQVHYRNYLARVRREARDRSQNRIGWLVVEGALVDGRGEPGVAGADAIARRLDELARKDELKALVVRVNSPGGSITASETLRRALNRFARDDRPVVVSMSSVAASGGYWMSMDADQIWAEPGTLTGSIGVFGILPNLHRPLANLGIHSDGVSTTETAGDLRSDRPLSEEAKQAVQALVDHNYRLFLEGVAEGRSLSLAGARQAAEGRVWSGEDALRLGLLDYLGGPDEAIAAAADLSGLDSYRVEEVSMHPDLASLLKQRFRLMLHQDGPVFADWVQPWIAPWRDAIDAFGWMRDPRGVYAHCLCETRL